MNLDLVNGELQILADALRQGTIDLQWEEMMQEMYQQWELEQYAEDCAELDAQYYGEWK